MKGFISRFVTNTRSWLVLTFIDWKVKKIGKWSEISTFSIPVSILLSKEFARIWLIIVALRLVTRVVLFIIGMKKGWKLWEKAVLQ